MDYEMRDYQDRNEDSEEDILAAYEFDYSEARPNPYAVQAAEKALLEAVPPHHIQGSAVSK